MEEKKAELSLFKEAPASIRGGEVEANAYSGELVEVPKSTTTINDAHILRKIDWNILPVMFLVYFLQFLDKVALNVCGSE